MNPDALRETIDYAYQSRAQLGHHDTPAPISQAIQQTVALLNEGALRVAEPKGEIWHVHEWIKKAILLYFKLQNNRLLQIGGHRAYDKIPLKYVNYTESDFERDGVRVVPPATVRYGAHVCQNAVLMPSYVNIGAWIGPGTMVDTWATVGSCAQIGANVHLSGGVGIGGVLEPLQSKPTIIEDNCFIGARSEIVEGVVVETGSVIAMGVYIGQSTRIYDRETRTISYGKVPRGSVVVPGTLPAADGTHSLYCAVIAKRVDEKTRSRTELNELLREAGSSKS